jgi:hypothetical protein
MVEDARRAWLVTDQVSLRKLRIGLIDTGVDRSRLNCDAQRVRCIDCYGNEAEGDAVGHGTLFARAFAQYVPSENSPELLSIRPDTTARIAVTDVCKAIERAIQEEVDVLAINLANTAYNAQMARLLAIAACSNIITIAPAGNMVRLVNTYPASLPTVISVAALDGEGSVDPMSNVTSNTDICSPQHYEAKLEEAFKRASLAFRLRRDSSKASGEGVAASCFFGTSMAVPVVSAAVALMKACNALLSVDQIRLGFRTHLTGVDVNSKGTRKKIPRLEFERVVQYSRSVKACQPDIRIEERLYFEVGRAALTSDSILRIAIANGCGERVEKDIDIVLSLLRHDLSPNPEYQRVDDSVVLRLARGQAEYKIKYTKPGKYLLRLWTADGKVTESLTALHLG